LNDEIKEWFQRNHQAIKEDFPEPLQEAMNASVTGVHMFQGMQLKAFLDQSGYIDGLNQAVRNDATQVLARLIDGRSYQVMTFWSEEPPKENTEHHELIEKVITCKLGIWLTDQGEARCGDLFIHTGPDTEAPPAAIRMPNIHEYIWMALE